MVRIRGLTKRYGGREVLSSIDLDVPAGTVMCNIGPSGSGKSTLLSCINHLERIDGGKLWVGGELVGYREHGGRLYELPERHVARMRQRVDIARALAMTRSSCCSTNRPPRWIPNWWARCSR